MFSKLLNGLILFANAVAALFFLICSYASYLHPTDWWFTGFLGLVFPYLFTLLIAFFVFWLFVKRRFAVLSLLVFIAALPGIRLHVGWHFNTLSYKEKTSEPHHVRLMNWNVRHFIPFEENDFKPGRDRHDQSVLSVIESYNPDVICFQEFLTMPKSGDKNPFQVLKKRGYRYQQFAGEDIFGTGQYSGIAIFSKYPVLKGGVIPYPPEEGDHSEPSVYADLLVEGDTVRVYSIHLRSFGFGSREYKTIEDVRTESRSASESKLLLKKMRNTFYWHGIQADFLADKISKSPYPTIVCGDFNDVPGSYAYSVIRGEHRDSFLEKGFGLGATFTSSFSFLLQKIPTLRIDYIFHDPKMTTTWFKRGEERLSDHAYLVADIQIK
jgi:endonuclease/exonuclease/phosphatase family metal-dependent hydrolase